MKIRTIVASTALILVATSGQASADCGAAVEIDANSITVMPDSGADTENLQCALDHAVENGISTVTLDEGEFNISAISITGFDGALTGKSQSKTIVNLISDGVDCEAADPSALRFYAGAPSVEKMTLTAEEMCGSSGARASMVGFYSDIEDCTKGKTMFGNVDRVALAGPGAEASDLLMGVTMSRSSECDDIVLGTLKVNRSDISGLAYGVVSSLGGAGQVDINFNTFSNMGTSIAVVNANQGSSITGNTIGYNEVENFAGIAGFGSVGILVGGDAGAPSENLTSIKRNTLNNGNAGALSFAVLVGQEDKKIKHTVWVSSNRFEGIEAAPASVLQRIDTGASSTTGIATVPISYEENFSSSSSLDGWVGYINVFATNCVDYVDGYLYEAMGSAVGVLAEGADGTALNVYSDYDSAYLPGSCLEANVFREATLDQYSIGDYRWSFDVELPESPGENAVGFIRVNSGAPDYYLVSEVTVPAATGRQSVEISLDSGMNGMLLQWGFATKAVDYENSGMLYDNVVFEGISNFGEGGSGEGGGDSASGGGDSGSGGGSEPAGSGTGYGVAAIDTDGVIVSGNRFKGGAGAWIVANGSSLGDASGWSIVDNNFTPSTAVTDIALGANTVSGVVGGGQGEPSYSSDGTNSVLEGSSVSVNTDALTSDISEQFMLEWGLLLNP